MCGHQSPAQMGRYPRAKAGRSSPDKAFHNPFGGKYTFCKIEYSWSFSIFYKIDFQDGAAKSLLGTDLVPVWLFSVWQVRHTQDGQDAFSSPSYARKEMQAVCGWGKW